MHLLWRFGTKVLIIFDLYSIQYIIGTVLNALNILSHLKFTKSKKDTIIISALHLKKLRQQVLSKLFKVTCKGRKWWNQGLNPARPGSRSCIILYRYTFILDFLWQCAQHFQHFQKGEVIKRQLKIGENFLREFIKGFLFSSCLYSSEGRQNGWFSEDTTILCFPSSTDHI